MAVKLKQRQLEISWPTFVDSLSAVDCHVGHERCLTMMEGCLGHSRTRPGNKDILDTEQSKSNNASIDCLDITPGVNPLGRGVKDG